MLLNETKNDIECLMNGQAEKYLNVSYIGVLSYVVDHPRNMDLN